MELEALADILSGRGISIDPGTILRVREGLWRARGSSGELVLRFVPGEAVFTRRAFSAMEQVRSSPSVSLQKVLDFIPATSSAGRTEDSRSWTPNTSTSDAATSIWIT